MNVDLALTAAYGFDLPPAQIAQAPVEPRDASRLLVVGPNGALEDRVFRDLDTLLRPDDVLVVNHTRVVRARLRGRREPGGGEAEVFILRPVDRPRFDARATRWLALVRPGRRLRIGDRVRFGDDATATITGVHDDGVREIAIAGLAVPALLDRYGQVPLPPYIDATGADHDGRAERYQTVFAQEPGSVAAPTASLHFTPALLERLRARGVTIVPLVLDVGIGTFRPMSGERIDDHRMHAETYAIPEATAAAIVAARAQGRRIVAAGTTVVRALEGSAAAHGAVIAGSGETALFITPGFAFRVVDAMITNFHLPHSTLLVLVAAFCGYEPTLRAYRHAVASGYRFFSFGDAMLAIRGE